LVSIWRETKLVHANKNWDEIEQKS